MTFVKIAFFLFLYYNLSSAQESAVETFTLKVTSPNLSDGSRTIVNRVPGDENIHVYATCASKNNWSNCTVVQEKYPFGGQVSENKCHTSFYQRYENESFFVISLHDGKVVFFYADPVSVAHKRQWDTYLFYRIMDMETCEWHEAKIRYKTPKLIRKEYESAGAILLQTHVLHYRNGSFAVFLYNPWVCKAARCKYTFDKEGNQIGEPASYLPEAYGYHQIRVYPTTDDEGKTVAVVSGPGNTNVFAAFYQTDRDVKMFSVTGSVITDVLDLGHEAVYDFDSSDNQFGVCWRSKVDKHGSTINCKVFDLTDTVSFDYPFNITTLSVKNSNIGRLILLFDKSEMEKSLQHEYYLRSIASDKDFEIDDLTCSDEKEKDVIPSIFPSSDSDGRTIISSVNDKFVCVSRVCRLGYSSEVVRRCYH